MAKQAVNLGAIAGDGTGDTARAAFNKLNQNHNEIYAFIGNGTALDAPTARTNLGVAAATHTHTLAQVTNAGSAAALNAPAVGVNAALAEVVKGDDTRLTNARTPVAHAHAAADVTSGVFAAARIPDLSATYSPVNHTHTALGITDFAESVDDRVAALLVAGTNIALTYNDVGNTLTVSATAGEVGSFVNDEIYGATWDADTTVAPSRNAVYDKVQALDAAKANATHSHVIADLPVAASGISSTTQVVRADDARLSNARAPTAHTHLKADITDFAHTHALGDLSNVVLTAPASGHVVQFNGTNWVNAAAGSGTGNVTTTGTPAANHLAYFSGAASITGKAAATYDPVTDTLGVANLVLGGQAVTSLADPAVSSVQIFTGGNPVWAERLMMNLGGTGSSTSVGAVGNLMAGMAYQPLAYAAALTANMADGKNFEVTLTGNATLEIPTGIKSGDSWSYVVTQGTGGNFVLTPNAAFKFRGGWGGLSSAAGARDRIDCTALSTISVQAVLNRDFK